MNLNGIENVEELGGKAFKAKIEESPERRNLVVAFYMPGCEECEELREAFTELGEKFAGAGLVAAASVNCAKQKALCKQEVNDQGAEDRASILYYSPGDEGRDARRHPGGQMSYKSLSSWLAKVMADSCEVLPNLDAARRWLSSDDGVPHVIFFSDRKTTPPLLKALSLEFKGRAALGIALANADSELASRLGVTSRPAMLHVLDEESLESDAFDKDFKKESLTRFLSRAAAKHRTLSESALRELTASRFGAGDCSATDSHFCVLLLRPTPGDKGAAVRSALRQLAHHVRKDPVRVFIVRQKEFARPFGLDPGAVVLYRPKRKRYKVYSGDATSADDLASFVDSAVGGGAPLPEVLRDAPSMKDEL